MGSSSSLEMLSVSTCRRIAQSLWFNIKKLYLFQFKFYQSLREINNKKNCARFLKELQIATLWAWQIFLRGQYYNGSKELSNWRHCCCMTVCWRGFLWLMFFLWIFLLYTIICRERTKSALFTSFLSFLSHWFTSLKPHRCFIYIKDNISAKFPKSNWGNVWIDNSRTPTYLVNWEMKIVLSYWHQILRKCSDLDPVCYTESSNANVNDRIYIELHCLTQTPESMSAKVRWGQST